MWVNQLFYLRVLEQLLCTCLLCGFVALLVIFGSMCSCPECFSSGGKLPPVSAGFLLGFDPEDGADMFNRNVKLSALQPE
jgi:hypothetical protein